MLRFLGWTIVGVVSEYLHGLAPQELFLTLAPCVAITQAVVLWFLLLHLQLHIFNIGIYSCKTEGIWRLAHRGSCGPALEMVRVILTHIILDTAQSDSHN